MHNRISFFSPPRSFDICISWFPRKINAQISCKLSIYFDDITLLIFYIFINCIYIWIILCPLNKTLFLLKFSSIIENFATQFRFFFFS